MALSANLSQDLANINQWVKENSLALNVDKSSVLAFRSKQKLVTRIGNKELNIAIPSSIYVFILIKT